LEEYWLTFCGDPVPETDSGLGLPCCHIPNNCGIVNFRRFTSICLTVTGRFSRHSAKSDKVMNLQHILQTSGSESGLIRIRIPDHFRLRLDALAEVCALWVLSSCKLCQVDVLLWQVQASWLTRDAGSSMTSPGAPLHVIPDSSRPRLAWPSSPAAHRGPWTVDGASSAALQKNSSGMFRRSRRTNSEMIFYVRTTPVHATSRVWSRTRQRSTSFTSFVETCIQPSYSELPSVLPLTSWQFLTVRRGFC